MADYPALFIAKPGVSGVHSMGIWGQVTALKQNRAHIRVITYQVASDTDHLGFDFQGIQRPFFLEDSLFEFRLIFHTTNSDR